MRSNGLRTAARAAVDSPALLAWCGVVAVLDLLTLVAALVLASGRGLQVVLTVLLAQRAVLACVLALTLPGAYAIARADDGGRESVGTALRAAPGLAARAAREKAPRLLASSLLVRAIALPVALAVAALLGALALGVDTVAVWAAAAGAPVDRGLLAVAGVSLALAGGAWLANGAVAYHDLLVLDREADVRSAWRRSLAATTTDGSWFLGQALLRGLLAVAPWIAGAATLIVVDGLLQRPPESAAAPWTFGVAGLAVLATAALARATLVAYHVGTYAERIRPAVAAGDLAVVDRPRRVAVAAAVVLAAVAGVGTVRTADVAPGPAVPEASLDGGDADAAVATAIRRTARRDLAFEYDESFYNETAERWQPLFDIDGAVDRDGRELDVTVALHVDADDVRRRTVYATDGLYALRPVPTRIRTHHPLETTVLSGNWSAAVGRPYAAETDAFDVLPSAPEGWTRVESDAATVTYVRSGVGALEDVSVAPSVPDPDDEDVEYLAEPELRIVVDREDVTVRRLETAARYRNTVDEDDVEVRRLRSTLSITDVGDVDVDRPDGLAGPGPLERLWDVVYYG